MERLDRGRLDFGVLIQPVDISKYDSLPLPVKNTWGLLMRNDHPLAAKTEITPADMEGLTLLISRQILNHDESQNPWLEWIGKTVDELDIALTYNNIGTIYDSQKKFKKALEYYTKALEIEEKALGKEHPNVALAYNNIGAIHNEKGDYRKALECHQKALEIEEKVLGVEHPNTAMSYNNIGSVYFHLRKYSEALEYYQKALAIWEKALGENHPNVQTVKNNINTVTEQMKRSQPQ